MEEELENLRVELSAELSDVRDALALLTKAHAELSTYVVRLPINPPFRPTVRSEEE